MTLGPDRICSLSPSLGRFSCSQQVLSLKALPHELFNRSLNMSGGVDSLCHVMLGCVQMRKAVSQC